MLIITTPSNIIPSSTTLGANTSVFSDVENYDEAEDFCLPEAQAQIFNGTTEQPHAAVNITQLYSALEHHQKYIEWEYRSLFSLLTKTCFLSLIAEP